MNIESLKFPVGRFVSPESYTAEVVNTWIKDIELFPTRLIDVLRGLNHDQLEWKYRPDGWNIKQVVHHCVDSHINSLVRFKLALTVDKPTITPYDQDAWIQLSDAQVPDLSDSLDILNGLHRKWAYLLNSLSAEQLNRQLIHPEHDHPLTLKHFIGLYAWHCNHHLGHVKQAIAYKGVFN